jgi:hypothetical protein
MKTSILAFSATALLSVMATPAHAGLGNNDDSFAFIAPQPVAEAPVVQKEEINFESNPNDPIDIKASLDATARPTEIAPPPPEVIVAPDPGQPQAIAPAPQSAPARPKWEKPVYIR